jgi:hypothetical protein
MINHSAQPEFYEHAASEGTAASGLLLSIAIGSLVAGVCMGFLMMVNSVAQEYGVAHLLAAICMGSGMIVATLFYAFSVLISNVVAIRKNSQHLAGIRAANQQEKSWQ